MTSCYPANTAKITRAGDVWWLSLQRSSFHRNIQWNKPESPPTSPKQLSLNSFRTKLSNGLSGHCWGPHCFLHCWGNEVDSSPKPMEAHRRKFPCVGTVMDTLTGSAAKTFSRCKRRKAMEEQVQTQITARQNDDQWPLLKEEGECVMCFWKVSTKND